ncbi:MAG: alpha/beta hydrolase family protein [Phycisphaerales bacterium]
MKQAALSRSVRRISLGRSSWPRIGGCWAISAGTLVLASLAGCLSREAAEPFRSEFEFTSQGNIDWPQRTTEDLDEKIRNTPRRVPRLVLDGSVPESEIDPDWLRAARRAEGRIFYMRKYGQGVIRRVRYADEVFTRFVSYSPLSDRPVDTRVPRLVERSRDSLEKFLNENAKGLKPADEKVLSLLYEGTQIRLSEPKREALKDGRPVGLIVHMAGLGSVEYEQPVLDELLTRGWAVLRVATPSVWWYEAKPYQIDREADITPTARKIARTIDDLVAEPAYAAEAALAYLARERPSIPQSPLVMVGCSAGALAAPAVVARLSGRFDAAVLVGGGANLLKLSQMSDLTDGGIRLIWTDPMGSAAHRNQLYEEYLAASSLDPFQTAVAMRGMPVLMVQAALDSTVPSSGGELLWECLGRPERWTFAGGHRLMFWRLQDHAVPIADWVGKNAGATRKIPLTSVGAAGDSKTPG